MVKQQVDAAKLKKAGSELTDLASKVNAEMKKLDENIQRVSSVWNSDAGATYVKIYNSDKANLNELAVIMQQMGTALNDFSTKYMQADDQALQVIGKNLAKG